MARNYTNAAPTQFQRLPEYTRDEDWIRAFLRRALIGHLGQVAEEQPYVTPTNFWYDDSSHAVYFHSNLSGRMADNLLHSPRVCLEVSEYGRFLPSNLAIEFSLQYRAVMVFGRVQIVRAEEEKSRVLYGLLQKYFPDSRPGLDYRPITAQELARTNVYQLQIDSWSGKENWQAQAKQSADWNPTSRV